tara:strand:+ start:570 stop:683 length:114 start_codon:yes stop_codon:yes gene_type:complete
MDFVEKLPVEQVFVEQVFVERFPVSGSSGPHQNPILL